MNFQCISFLFCFSRNSVTIPKQTVLLPSEIKSTADLNCGTENLAENFVSVSVIVDGKTFNSTDVFFKNVVYFSTFLECLYYYLWAKIFPM